MNDAIHQDVSQPSIEGTVAEEQLPLIEEADNLTDRERKMRDLVDAHNASNWHDEEPEEIPEEKVADVARPDPLASLGYYQNAQGEYVTKLKVNGQEREVSAEQLKAYMQKDIAADQKLQHAADWEKRLKEQEEQMRIRSQAMQSSLSQPPKEELGADELKRAKAVLEKVYDGDQETAAKELAELINSSRRQQPTLSEDQIKAVVDSQLTQAEQARAKRNAEKAWQDSVAAGINDFNTNFKELASDEVYFNEVDRRTKVMLDKQKANDPEFINKTPQEMIRIAAEETKRWADEKTGKNSASQSRQDSKSKLSSMPAASNLRYQKPQKPQVDHSPSAVIENMRRQRSII